MGLLLLFFLTIGGAGMVMGRRHPLLSLPFFCLFIFVGYLGIQFQSDLDTGAHTILPVRLAYIVFAYLAPLSGVTMTAVGAVIGMRGNPNNSLGWRRISGVVGLVLLELGTYLSYLYGRNVYYEYYLWPIEKAPEGYVMPLRWHDIVTQMGIWSVVLGMLITSAYLLRLFLMTEPRRSENPQ